MKISIIILSYNDYAGTTGPCLTALMTDPDFPAWEVIVVDNASDAETRQSLMRQQQQTPALHFVYNAKNLGFAAGNNVGMRMATGDVVILLNSDTIAPPGMIKRLAAHFTQDNALGLVGPVSNAAGNEQCILCAADSIEGKIEAGLRYANSGGADIMPAYRMDFFCVAISRAVLDQVGLLDEAFGRGYFEDFDYSLRVRRAGFRLAVAEDAFVYHRGSASFSKAPREIRELHKRNKQRVIDKYGQDLRFPHVRESNLAILTQYAERKKRGEILPEYRVRSRMDYATNNRPKGWFKRWGYLRRTGKLRNTLGAGGFFMS